MLERVLHYFNRTNNNTGRVPQGKAIQLSFNAKHEPFGAINIARIKRALDEEDFAELQSLYHLMQRDLKIAGAVLARRQPLLQLRYTVTSDNQAFVDWVTDNVDISALVNLLSFAIYAGVSLVDVQYTVADGKLVPSFRHIPPRFLHAHKGEHLKNTAEHLYIKQGTDKRFISKLDGDKHVFHKHPIDAGEMTDFSLASKLVWYFSLKHIALAHNLQYFDAVATPPLIAKTEGDEDEVIKTLFGLKSAGVAVVNKDDIVEFLNVSSKAEFLQFIEYIDRQIATVILGNTLSTGEGSKGSYSQSKVHENRQREVLAFDAMLISQCITRFLNRLEKLNFANAKGVKFAFDLKEKQDLNELSQVVKNLSDSGFEMDDKDIEEQFGLKILGKKPVPGTPADRPNTQANNRMAVNATSTNNSTSALLPCGCQRIDNNSTAKPVDALDEEVQDTTSIEEALLAKVQEILANASNYDDAYTALLDAYPDFAIAELDAALFKAVANSTLHADTEAS